MAHHRGRGPPLSMHNLSLVVSLGDLVSPSRRIPVGRFPGLDFKRVQLVDLLQRQALDDTRDSVSYCHD